MAKLQYAIDDRNKLHKDANISLDKNLSYNEKVKVIIQGLSDSAIIGTDTRCFVYKRGIMGGAAFGGKLISWDYADLNGVQLEIGLHSGVVSLQGPGTTSKDMSYWNTIKMAQPQVLMNFHLLRNYISKLERELLFYAHLYPMHSNLKV